MRGARIPRITQSGLAIVLSALTSCAVPVPVATVPATINVPRGGAFFLDLGHTHQAKLAVVTPDERWARLIDGQTTSSLMSEDEFLGLSRLKIDTATLRGAFAVDGATVVMTVFASEGQYRLVVTDNLDTEPENMRSVSYRVAYD